MLQTAHAASKACLSPSLLSVFGRNRIVTSFLTLPHSHRHEEWRVVSQHKVQTKLRGGQTFSLLLMWQWGQPHLLSVRHPETEVVTVPLTRTSQDSVHYGLCPQGSICLMYLCRRTLSFSLMSF